MPESNGHWTRTSSLKAYDRIPVNEYVSQSTGLTFCIAEVEGPIVSGYFCLATEAFDDDGLPHTLEHLIFLGSENYPFKGVLDLLANRCLASGTNAWTDIDHTCYTMDTAGNEGFLALMPIFLEHILFPILSEEAFLTEVHHITKDGQDAGVVYCEMQARENSAESRLNLEIFRNIYPGKCGYSSETGGILKNLRESTSNKKVIDYHRAFYRPENLKIIICGQVEAEQVMKALEPLEQKILLKKKWNTPFQRPWQSAVPALENSKTLQINFPADDEEHGLYAMAWRGPSCVNELYKVTACDILLVYLTDTPIAPLQKLFVETEDPFASDVSGKMYENSEECLCLLFENVPIKKMSQIQSELQKELQRIIQESDFDLERMHSILNKTKMQNWSQSENSPHQCLALMIIGHMLYGKNENDLKERLNPITFLDQCLQESKEFWFELLKTYFVGNKFVSVECYPSKAEQIKMAEDERNRIEQQRNLLGEDGLNKKFIELEKAIEYNERAPPLEMLTSVPVPGINSIKFHKIKRYSSDIKCEEIDLTNLPIFTYFDDIDTNFVYLLAILDTSNIPDELRVYLPLLKQAILESPIEINGELIPYEEVVENLNADTVNCDTKIGLSGSGPFSCGLYSHNFILDLQLEASKYSIGIEWIRKILFCTKFTNERIKIIATRMINTASKLKRSARNIAENLSDKLWYKNDTNVNICSVLNQPIILRNALENLDTTVAKIEQLRELLIESNPILYIAGSMNRIGNIREILKEWPNMDSTVKSLKTIPDSKLIDFHRLKRVAIGLGTTESAYLYKTCQSIQDFKHSDLPALKLLIQYLIQAEGPMWKRIRGKGYAYHYSINVNCTQGRINFLLARATNIIGAFAEAKDIVQHQLVEKKLDKILIQSARSSLIFDLLQLEKTVGSVSSLSMKSYFIGEEIEYNRRLLNALYDVNQDDLIKVGIKYLAPLFDEEKSKTALVTDSAKLSETLDKFNRMGVHLAVLPSLDENIPEDFFDKAN